ncbi:transporter substrate-binding domain-containing protein [Oxalobacteraceae bacterium]|nr:transporter substrate-binding domain-containing protein [Oxalobacteraceae bacterium]
MNIYRRIYLLALIIMAAGAARSSELRILTTEVPPLAFVKDGKVGGFCVDLVQDIQRRLGNASTIEVFPWARAYLMAQTEPNTLLVCPKRTPEREKLFQWIGPLLISDTNFYAKKGSHLTLRTLAEARKLPNILVLRESYSYTYLNANGFQNLYLVNSPSGMMKMLIADRAPVMVMERIQADAVIRDEHIPPQDVHAVLTLQSLSSNLAFSPDVPAATVKQWKTAFEAMKQDGSYARVHRKWFSAPRAAESP